MVGCDNLFRQQYPLSNTIKGNFKETAGILNAELTAEQSHVFIWSLLE